MPYNPRQILGAIVLDVVPFVARTMAPSLKNRTPTWVWNRNRHDFLVPGTNANGIKCNWTETRQLHLTNVFPFFSRLLLWRMLRDWPIQLSQHSPPDDHEQPEVSFVIGHSGLKRIDHLNLTIRSLFGQLDVACEIIVVEQGETSLIESLLPPGVRYQFVRSPEGEVAYNRSRGFNVGAAVARGRMLILHDGDLVAPQHYAREALGLANAGFDVINLKRFICYLTEPETRNAFAGQRIRNTSRSESVLQNACGGGSLAITRAAYFQIGGMDEEFVGWGGEDEEFWDRCQRLNVAESQIMPLIHLWHPSQPLKRDFANPTARLLREKRQLSSVERIRLLKSLNCFSGNERNDQMQQRAK